jgi:hypothetical protein
MSLDFGYVFPTEDAAYNAAAQSEEQDDEGWKYEVVRYRNIYKVAVYDENGEFVAYL